MTELKEDNKEKLEGQEKPSIKEERIRKIAMIYYSRPDIRKTIFEFAKFRECVPRYFEGFGKRPDNFQYDSDILELAKRGATSFHCSEELWEDALQLSTEMTEKEQKKMRKGWDLLIDVDSKYLDYSKIYAELVIEILKSHGIKNIGVKFSGSKGWHIIVPNKAFPEQISGKKTSEMFPEWPRQICAYINSKIAEKLKQRVLEISDSNMKKELTETYCEDCNLVSKKTNIVYLECPSCKTKSQSFEEMIKHKRILRCAVCNKQLEEVSKEEIFYCDNCKKDSKKSPENFKERVKSRHIDADIILVSPRHLFRMPYSLHEKTSLASAVINPEQIKEFQPRDADPLRIVPKSFIPNSEPGEATFLLREALEHQVAKEFMPKEKTFDNSDGKKVFKEFEIKNISPDIYPPAIKTILLGMKTDGRKRALFILLSFFKSIKMNDDEIKKEIETWNSKNYDPLRTGYIRAQISWYSKSKAKLPPNYDKPYYNEIGITPTPDELKSKNPVSYAIKKSLFLSRSYKNNGK